MLADAIVNTLVVAAQDDDILGHGEGVGHRLVKLLAVGCGENDFVVVALGLESGDAGINGLALHHHSRKATKGIVVHAAMLVGGIVAQVVHVDFNEALLLSTGQNGRTDKALQHFGQHGDNIYTHRFRGIV